jgi:hypothetical protein
VRFSSDQIGFRFDAFRSSDKQVIFNLGGVSVRQKKVTVFFSLEESSSFNFNLGSPPDGDYPRTVYAPQAVLDYYYVNGGTIRAYLLSATVDNGFQSVQIPSAGINGLGSYTFEGGMLFGYGTQIDVLILQRANGPCYFSGTVRWEVS